MVTLDLQTNYSSIQQFIHMDKTVLIDICKITNALNH